MTMHISWIAVVLLMVHIVYSRMSIFDSVIQSALKQEHPRRQDCTNYDRDFSSLQGMVIRCNKFPNGSYFGIRYMPMRNHKLAPWIVEISCSTNYTPNWSDVYLKNENKLKYVSKIEFRECKLPKGRQLISIVNELIVNNSTNVDTSDLELDEFMEDRMMSLIFNSHQNLTLTLTRTVLEGFTEYREIDLRHNKLRNVSNDLLRGFQQLRTLKLTYNDLHTITREFLNFPKLEELNLGNNKLQVIEKTTFENLPMLKHLVLRQNQLRKIENNAFDKNWNLKTLNLLGNFFSVDTFSPDLFYLNKKLSFFSLSENHANLTELPSNIFKSQSNLENIYLDNVGLMNVEADLLQNLGNLMILILANNYLTTIPNLFFKTCHHLTRLDLSNNRIAQVSAKTFSGLENIKSLNMSYNKLHSLDMNIFQSMLHLTKVYFHNNELTFHNFSTLESGVNKNLSPFHHCRDSMEILDLSNNKISEIYDDWLSAPRLLQLWLENNHLTHLSHKSIQFNSTVNIDVNLERNRIRSIDLSGLDSLQNDRTHRVVKLLLDENPVECDCSIQDLFRHYRKTTSATSQMFYKIAMDNLTCAGPPELKNIPVKKLNEQSLMCKDLSPCPIPCNCSFRAWDQAYLINCSHRGLTEIPAAVNPGLNRAIELNLTGNSLESVPKLSALGYHNLTVLSLSNNLISSLSLRDLVQNLTRLYLHGNHLTQLNNDDITLLANSTKLEVLTLHENPWRCDCDTLDFVNFIQAKQFKFSELHRMTCNSTNKFVTKMTHSELCATPLTSIIVAGSVVIALLLFIIILVTVYYRFQTEIKVWLFAHRLLPWLVNEAELDRDKVYDAFISYSHQDEDFVAQTLVPKLEEGPDAFKLCLHYRDWLVGEWIAEQIARSVAESRRTIVVLSRNFLESEWGKMEFRTAHSTALSEGRARVIVIIYGDIGPIDELEPELASYLRTNTYVQWGDRWFWEKLRYALPHPVKHSLKNSGLQLNTPEISASNENTN